MRRVIVLAAAIGAGCGGSQPALSPEVAARPVEYCPESISAPIPEEPTAVQWWIDRANACPDGATLQGMAPPMGDEVWCARPDGTKYGRWTWWYREGRRVSDGYFDADGEPEGLWVAWHENGKRKMQGSYRAGKKEGRWTMWHENGEPATDITFADGVEHGPWTWWYENGNKAGQGEFLGGKPHGRWIRCADGGTITKIEIYDNDRLVDWIDFEQGRRLTQTDR